MVLESTFICVDNSEFMRNGDYAPTRLQAQQEAVSLIAQTKIRANPENNVGILTLGGLDVLATLTADCAKLIALLHSVRTSPSTNFLQGIKIAHLALKHRLSKNHRARIVAFVGSPLVVCSNEGVKSLHKDEDEIKRNLEQMEVQLVKMAKKLKKEKVSVDVVSFGEDLDNASLLSKFVETVQSGNTSHLVTIPPGPHLTEALITSPIIQSEDGSGPTISVGSRGADGSFDFGIDPNEDPELTLALRVSLEEQRARQQQQEQVAADGQASHGQTETTVSQVGEADGGVEDVSMMNEEEQIAYAMRMSMMQDDSSEPTNTTTEPSTGEGQGASVSNADAPKEGSDGAFLQNLLSNLSGVEGGQKVDEKKGEDKKKDEDAKK